MPRHIDWNKIQKRIFEDLHAGLSVKEVAEGCAIGYSSLCSFLKARSIDNKGLFKSKIVYNDEVNSLFKYIIKQHDSITSISETWGLTAKQIQLLLKKNGIRKEWNLAESSSVNVANGRRAEIYVKDHPAFRVLKDANKLNSKSPWDLSLAPNQEIFKHWNGIDKFGAVDVKSTFLREESSGTHRWKFNVQNVCRPNKYVFLVGYDETFTEVQVLLILPYKFVKGKQSLSVSKEKLFESKYKDFLFETYYEEAER